MLIVVLWNVSGSRILVLTTGRDMLVFILQCNIAQEISLEGSNVHKTELDAEVFPLIYRTHHPPMQHSSSRTTHTHTHTHSHTHTHTDANTHTRGGSCNDDSKYVNCLSKKVLSSVNNLGENVGRTFGQVVG